MNKRELTEAIASKTDFKKFEVQNYIDLLIEVISETLDNEQKVVMSNFGTFKIVKRKKKSVVHPGTNKRMEIPPQKIVKFFPALNLKKKVQSK
jgi:nucleoid DNA-binding protein